MSRLSPLQFHRRCLRRTAWVTLVGWLWALTVGVVNACAVAPSGAAGHDAVFVHLAAAHGQAEHAVDPSHEPDAGRVSCLKFCDDGSSALSKSTASPMDPGTAAMALAPTWRLAVSAPVAAIWLPWHTQLRPRLPLTLRFQRLTL